jgi:hypothetical protein
VSFDRKMNNAGNWSNYPLLHCCVGVPAPRRAGDADGVSLSRPCGRRYEPQAARWPSMLLTVMRMSNIGLQQPRLVDPILEISFSSTSFKDYVDDEVNVAITCIAVHVCFVSLGDCSSRALESTFAAF